MGGIRGILVAAQMPGKDDRPLVGLVRLDMATLDVPVQMELAR